MINISKINDQEYLQNLMVSLDRSNSPILDITSLSSEDKLKVESMYQKLQFRSAANNTPLRLSLMTHVAEEPKVTKTLDIQEVVVAEDETDTEISTKKKRKP